MAKVLLTSKSGISKRNTSKARLEIGKQSLHCFPAMANEVCHHVDRQHGITVLDNKSWGRYEKYFSVANRVKKIAETTGPIKNTWKNCPSDLNQADLR